MGNKKISQLTPITGVTDSDILVIVQSGVTYQIPFSALTSSFAINLVDETGHHVVYSGNNLYVKSEIHEDLSKSYGERNVYVGHFDDVHDPNNPDKFGVYAGQTDSFNLISAHGESDQYLQVNVINFSNGTNASSDIVATNDQGNEDTGYIDMGINSSQYTGTTLVGSANDAYLYSTGADLYIGNAVANKSVIIFNGGFDARNNAKVFINDQGTIGINTDTYDQTNPASLYVFPPNNQDTFNIIYARGIADNYTQFNLQNTNGGELASADIVATNDIGTETSYYVDMGINSSGHGVDPTYTVGGPNDTYLLSVANNHYIGTPNSKDIILFSGPDFDGDTNAKLRLTANSGHTMTGDFTISGSTTIVENLILPDVINLDYVDDAAAGVGGVPVGGIYHTSGVLKIRLPDQGPR